MKKRTNLDQIRAKTIAIRGFLYKIAGKTIAIRGFLYRITGKRIAIRANCNQIRANRSCELAFEVRSCGNCVAIALIGEAILRKLRNDRAF